MSKNYDNGWTRPSSVDYEWEFNKELRERRDGGGRVQQI